MADNQPGRTWRYTRAVPSARMATTRPSRKRSMLSWASLPRTTSP